jgi:hypothetical protein
MKTAISSLWVVIVLLWSAGAQAQAPPGGRKFEIMPYGGAVWSRGYDVLLGAQKGTLSMKGSAMWGVAFDYAVKDSVTQIEVLYNRQDTDLTFDVGGEETDIASAFIEYIHVGALLGVQRSDVLWYTSFSLGTTRFGAKEGSTGDEWRFSIMFGLGAKHYFNDRVGVRVQARAPYMFVEDTAKFYCGETGCLTSAGGRGIWQFDLSLGLVIKL